MRLLRLTLTDFRNYAALTWRPEARLCVLTGPNGSGKTNLLEAVSLLTPGRGLRGARNAEFLRRDAATLGRWGVNAELRAGRGTARDRHRLAARGDGGSAGIPARRGAAAQPGRGGRGVRFGVADAADGPAVRGRRFGPAPLPGSSGLGARTRPCARGVGLRGGDGGAQPVAGAWRRRPGLAVRSRGRHGPARRGGGRGARPGWWRG